MRTRTRKRAWRRHHIVRLKAKCIRENYWGYGNWRNEGFTKSALGVCVNTPTVCTCYMCGNPRKYWNEVTLQEKKAGDIANSQEY